MTLGVTVASLGLVIAITGLALGLWFSRTVRRLTEIRDLLVEIRDRLR